MVVEHGVQYKISSLDDPIRMPCGRVIARSIHQTRQQGRFGQADIADVFAKVSLGGFPEPPDIERAALSHIHLIHVHSEYLGLGESMLELDRNHDFRQLSAYAPLV